MCDPVELSPAHPMPGVRQANSRASMVHAYVPSRSGSFGVGTRGNSGSRRTLVGLEVVAAFACGLRMQKLALKQHQSTSSASSLHDREWGHVWAGASRTS